MWKPWQKKASLKRQNISLSTWTERSISTETSFPGADGFLKKVRESGRDFYFFTNNSSNNVASCRDKLAKMGFPVDEKRVIISSHVTIDFLKRHRPRQERLSSRQRATDRRFQSCGHQSC
ncbi:MAG: hypothetical protein ACLTDI_10635 [Acutalibacteraceae bacterium]